MGCCVSVPSHEASNKKEKGGFSLESRAPPPSAEEETVKEVLSETPKPRHEPVMLVGGDVKKEVEETKPVCSKVKEDKDNNRQDSREVVEEESAKRQEVEANEENMSEVSEICSLTMSESVSTTTVRSVADGKDDGGDGEVRQQQQRQRVSRSPAKLPARNRVMGQSPFRRSEQSPSKRRLNNGSVRSVYGGSSREESGQSTMVRRGGSMPDPRRRDPGESSGRRSRSPATRSTTMNRSPSTRRTTQSPGRVRTDPNESGSRKLEGKWAINQNQNNNNDNKDCSTNESLENPLVSLECFIFL